MPSRYQPLADYLAAHSGDVVRLTFAEVEAIIGISLPPTAYTSEWWAKKDSRHAQWLMAGWRRTVTSIRARSRARAGENWVEFRRVAPPAPLS